MVLIIIKETQIKMMILPLVRVNLIKMLLPVVKEVKTYLGIKNYG